MVWTRLFLLEACPKVRPAAKTNNREAARNNFNAFIPECFVWGLSPKVRIHSTNEKRLFADECNSFRNFYLCYVMIVSELPVTELWMFLSLAIKSGEIWSFMHKKTGKSTLIGGYLCLVFKTGIRVIHGTIENAGNYFA
jgi:hypothetical protein